MDDSKKRIHIEYTFGPLLTCPSPCLSWCLTYVLGRALSAPTEDLTHHGQWAEKARTSKHRLTVSSLWTTKLNWRLVLWWLFLKVQIYTFGPSCRPGWIFMVRNGWYRCPAYSTKCFRFNSHLWGVFQALKVSFVKNSHFFLFLG